VGLASPFDHGHKGIRWYEVAHVAVVAKTRGGRSDDGRCSRLQGARRSQTWSALTDMGACR
jgi:hypothetical protein